MTGGLVLRIAVSITGVVALALAAAVALTVASLSEVLSDTYQARFAFFANEVRDNVETGLDLGLALSELDNVQEIVEARAAKNESVLAIRVVDNGGSVVFRGGAGDAEIVGGSETQGQVREPIVNTFGKQVGRVELVYTTRGSQRALTRVTSDLAMRAGALVGGVAAVAFVAATLIVGRLPRRLARVKSWFDAGSVADTPSSDLERAAAEAVGTVITVHDELDTLTRRCSVRSADAGANA